MKAHILKNFASTPQEERELQEILEYDDVKFKAILPKMMSQLNNSINSAAFTTEILKSLKDTPIQDIEAEKKGINAAKQEILEDDSLSQEKKDFLISIIDGTTGRALELYETMREPIPITIEKSLDTATIPTYAHLSDAGADLYSAENVTIQPHETAIINTGIKMAIPKGYEVQIRPRSGLSAKTNLRIANAPGTIDAGYRNNIGVILTNIGDTEEVISIGDRIAQAVIAQVPMMIFTEGKVDENTDRGTGGFGSTGM